MFLCVRQLLLSRRSARSICRLKQMLQKTTLLSTFDFNTAISQKTDCRGLRAAYETLHNGMLASETAHSSRGLLACKLLFLGVFAALKCNTMLLFLTQVFCSSLSPHTLGSKVPSRRNQCTGARNSKVVGGYRGTLEEQGNKSEQIHRWTFTFYEQKYIYINLTQPAHQAERASYPLSFSPC